MPLFRYEALDRNGKTVVGAMQATSEQEVFGRLTSMGYNPVLAQSAPLDTAAARPGHPAVSRSIPAHPFTAPGAVPVGASSAGQAPARLSASKRSIARMYHQLYIAFRAGMPAFQAISTVSAQVPEHGLRQALYELSMGVRDGRRLSDLMEQYPRIFSRGDIGMVRAAELGGFLPEAFGNLSQQHEQDDNAQRRLRIWIWFLHANVFVLFLTLPLGFFVVPAVASLDVMAGLRVVARMYLLLSLPAATAYVGFLAWFQWARGNPSLARWWHARLLRLPALGRINDLRAKAVFTRALQQLVHVGIPLSMAWETAARAVPNLYLSSVFSSGTPVVDATARLSTALAEIRIMDPEDIGMVATGEATGEIAQSLAYLADRYEQENRTALGAGVVRGALTFITWSVIVGLIGMAVLSWSLYQSGGGIFKAVEKLMGVGE